MKISEMIQTMQDFAKENGDVEVLMFDPERLEDGELVECPAFIAYGTDASNKLTFVICDKETRESFMEFSE